ncbi:VOC family protein [Uruburuella testudinis]|uniref:VOC family protein n=1 Tax=Uruburuella testudinis TaxID=1282863 RepID=A0ABY4DVI3_9NEIS|nr:VOC family protein [Uruburuella testudinis]UOO82724.1 VOC family protein [Uruburuella testudinis]
MAFEILGIDHVVLRIRNRQRMLDFYCKVLGCTLERELTDLGLIQLRAGRSIIDFAPIDKPLGQARSGEPLPEHANLEHFCLRIEPFDEALLTAHLQAHGIRMEEPAVRYGGDGFGPSIFITDPEGNIVELKGAPERPPLEAV